MVKIDLSICDECGTCISVCPADALLLTQSLTAEAAKCTSCGRCVSTCPFGALALTNKEKV